MQNNYDTLGMIDSGAVFSQAGEMSFIINSIVNKIQTVTLVQVVAVKAGATGAVGTVDVKPLVAQVNPQGETLPHSTIFNIPYFRLQGGKNAVILDPVAGDIGMCGFCSRDISSVKNSKKAAPPQSYRKFDYADGLYFGGFLNGAPNQYVFFKDSGIDVVSTGEINIKGSKVIINAPVETTGTIQAKGDITDNSASGGKSMKNMREVYDSHNHRGDSGGNTSAPNQKTA